jgi:hypothetical protein
MASTQAIQKTCELQQVCNTEECAPLSDDDLRIWDGEVRPLRGDGTNDLLIDLQQEPRAIAVVPLAHADERLPAEGMERMRYAHKAHRSNGNVCILN